MQKIIQTARTTGLIIEFSKVAGFKFNMQTSCFYLPALNTWKVKLKHHLKPQTYEMLGIHVTKIVQDMLQYISERNFKRIDFK